MTAIQNLKNLAESATPGPWECREAEGAAAICHQHGWVADDFSEQTLIDTRYMAAANPAAVLGLIDERSVALLQLDIQRDIAARRYEEIEKLKAENEALRKDAERYQWLRSRESSEDPEISVTQWTQLSPDRAVGAAPRLEDLDVMVDVAMSKDARA
jgi:hypothetical protein